MLADPAQIDGVKIHKLICLPILGKASTAPEQVILRAMGVYPRISSLNSSPGADTCSADTF